MPIRSLLFTLMLCLASLAAAGAQESESIAITVYNEGSALIRDRRSLSLEQGQNRVNLADIAASIDPSSVSVRFPDSADIRVLEQSHAASTASRDALFKQFAGETITVTAMDGTVYSGELLYGRGNDLILRGEAGEIVMPNINTARDIRFPGFPEALAAKPTLQWLLMSAAAGDYPVEISYLAGGMSWTADYNLRLNADESALDLQGWVTLSNRSGSAFNNARLQLVAGDIQRVQAEPLFAEARVMAFDMAAGASDEVEQREIFQYQLYEIARPVSIKDRETKQIEFVSGSQIAAETFLVFDASPRTGGYYAPIDYPEGYGAEPASVLTYLTFSSSEETGLGADLPAGRVRVTLEDEAGAGLLIGEDRIGHTGQGDDVTIRLGSAFDLSGTRRQRSYENISRTVARESFEISLRNRKDDETVEVRVPERLYRWSDWEIIESSAPYKRLDAATIEFRIQVAPGDETTLSYTVEYTFPRLR